MRPKTKAPMNAAEDGCARDPARLQRAQVPLHRHERCHGPDDEQVVSIGEVSMPQMITVRRWNLLVGASFRRSVTVGAEETAPARGSSSRSPSPSEPATINSISIFTLPSR